MEWDQYIFKKISEIVQYIRTETADPLEEANKVNLDEMSHRLTYLAQMICGVPIRIYPAEKIGGWKGSTFFLPPFYTRGMNDDINRNYYVFRTIYMSGQFLLFRSSLISEEDQNVDRLHMSEKYAAQIIEFLKKQFPFFEELYLKIIDAELDYQHKKFPNHKPTMEWVYGKHYAFDDKDWNDYNELINPLKKSTVADEKDKEKYTEVKGKNVENTQILRINTKEQEEYTLTHNFEKIETLDTFSGRWRNFDGSDDMDEHAEALQELDIQQLVRVDSPVHSIYKTDFVNAMGLHDVDVNISHYDFSYPEWNEKSRQYKENYCKLIYNRHKESRPEYTQTILKKSKSKIQKLKRNSEKHLSDYYVKKRLAEGDEPDLDALVETYTDIHTGKTPNENVYISKRKKTKDIAILVLTDCSLSTDGYTLNRRILDIEKEAIIIASEVWDSFQLKFQIDGFSSHTHSQCYYTTYKAFHENWTDVKYRVGDMNSSGYTRIGAAIRHATYILSNIKADKKWLLLLSDGKPNDYDTYEGDYGIYDVKKAIREAESKNIFSSAIAIEASAKFYYPKMFGTAGYKILNHTNHLSDVLTQFYINLLK